MAVFKKVNAGARKSRKYNLMKDKQKRNIKLFKNKKVNGKDNE